MEKVLQQILGELKELRQGQDALRGDVTGLQQGQARLEKRQEAQGKEIESLSLSLARFENNAYDKFGALFDADRTRQETLEEIKEQLAAHDARLDIHGGKRSRSARRQRQFTT